MLEDGEFAAIVIDATEVSGAEPGTIRIELAVAEGPHKGEVLAVTARKLHRDPLDLLAVPATLRVLAGDPSVSLEG